MGGMASTGEARRPGYADHLDMRGKSQRAGPAFARQALLTCAADLPKPVAELDVLDVGSGYGYAAVHMAAACRSVVGIEPTGDLHATAVDLARDVPNLEFRRHGVEELADVAAYDLVVLDNVYEHLPAQRSALAQIDRSLRPGGVVYMLMPNRLWPLEVHYGLPFLSWLPLPAANRYLRWSGRGGDYADASYARTLWTLRRHLNGIGWDWRLTLPADPSATHLGNPVHYRAGMWALSRFPALWAISKSFMVVARKG